MEPKATSSVKAVPTKSKIWPPSARSEGKEGKAPPRTVPSLSSAALDGFAKWRKGALAVRFVPVLSPKVPRYGFGRRFDEFRFGSWRSSKLCALTALIGMSKRNVLNHMSDLTARRCLPLLDSFEEEGIDDTDEGDEEARRSFENCVGSYVWLWEQEDFDWTSLAGRTERESKST
eukprot:symbB.v1.2.034984.t1/scaffold4617.1/size37413/1